MPDAPSEAPASEPTFSEGCRVAIDGLVKAAAHNGKTGIVLKDRGLDRLAIRLLGGGNDERLSVKRANLTVLPTPSVGLVIVGVDGKAGRAVLQTVLEMREAYLRGDLGPAAYTPVLALVGKSGAVHAARRSPCAEVFKPELPSRPHGGLSDAELRPACGEGGLEKCPGYLASKGEYRRLRPALGSSATPSVVVVDMSEGCVAATMLDGGDFCIERYGGRCVAVGKVSGLGAAAARPSWLTVLDPTSTPYGVLRAVFEVFSGWIPPLVPAPESPPLTYLACLWCGKHAQLGTTMGVCGSCFSGSYCSAACQLAELQDDRALCHAAYCPLFRQHVRRDTTVRLPDDGVPETVTWVRHLMEHGGGGGNECTLLQRIGHHHWPYTLFCACEHKRPYPRDEPDDVAALAAALPPPATGGPPSAPLTSWAQWYAFRRVDTASPVALLLSFPMTAYHVLTLCGAVGGEEDPPSVGGDDGGGGGGKSVVVHYLGAAEREAALLPFFGELGALLRREEISRLTVEMVGPSAPELEPTVFDGVDGVQVEVRWHRGLYDRITSTVVGCGLETTPDVVVAPNSGIFEFDEWQPTIACIEELSCPFYFTDYSEGGLFAASVAIREAHGLRLSYPSTLNPFRQPFDRRLLAGCAGSLGVPWLGNGFVAGVFTEGEEGCFLDVEGVRIAEGARLPT